ncbi:hypothetical protein BGZ94_005663 [Podila epigama]|nr:hypothetical protein BGZ94_005663 [Podila epigama]
MATNNVPASISVMTTPELVTHIVQYLPVTALRHCSQISRVWYRVCMHQRLTFREFGSATRELFEASPKRIYVLTAFVLQYNPTLVNTHSGSSTSGPYQFVFSCQARAASVDSYASTNSSSGSGREGRESMFSSGESYNGGAAHSTASSHRRHRHHTHNNLLSRHSSNAFRPSAIIPNVFFRTKLEVPSTDASSSSPSSSSSSTTSSSSSTPTTLPTLVQQHVGGDSLQQLQPHVQPQQQQQQQQQQLALDPTFSLPSLVLPPSIGQQLDTLASPASTQPPAYIPDALMHQHPLVATSNPEHAQLTSTTATTTRTTEPATRLMGGISELTLSPSQIQQGFTTQPPIMQDIQLQSSVHIVPCPFEYTSDESIMSLDDTLSTRAQHGRRSGSDNSQGSSSGDRNDMNFGATAGPSGQHNHTTTDTRMAPATATTTTTSSTTTSMLPPQHHVTERAATLASSAATEEYDHSQGYSAHDTTSSTEPIDVLSTGNSGSSGNSGDVSNSSGERMSGESLYSTSAFVGSSDSSSSRGRHGEGKGKAMELDDDHHHHHHHQQQQHQQQPQPQLPNWSMTLGTYYYEAAATNAMIRACREHMESRQGQGSHLVDMSDVIRIVWNEERSQEYIWTVTTTLMDRSNPGEHMVERDFDPHAFDTSVFSFSSADE